MGRNRTLTLLASLFLLLSSACVPGQASEVALYREVLDRGDPALEAPAEGEALTLQVALLLGNRANESLALEGESYLQALIERRRVAARFLPTLALAPSYFAREGSQGQADGEIGRSVAVNGVDVPLDVRLSISPVRDASDILAAGAEVAEREAALRDAQDRLLLDIAQAFYEAFRAEQLVAVLRSSVELQEARLVDVKARNEIGFARSLDVELTRSQGAQTKIDLLEADTDSRTSRSLLAFLTAWRGALSSRLEDTLEVPQEVPEIHAAMEQAERDRPDIQARIAALRAAEHRVRSAYGEYFPSISANLSYFLSRDSEPTDRRWNSLLEISVPLFSAGVIEADVREALSELRKAKLQYSLKSREVRRDVEVTRENLSAAHRRQQQTKVRLEAAESALTLANAMYEVGTATNLERLTAQDGFITTRLQLTNAELETKLAYLNYLRTVGSLYLVAGLSRPSAESEEHRDA